MVVRHGYKQTEMGVIPADWEIKLLPDVCHFRGGKAHEKYICESGQFICVNSKFVSTDGGVIKYSSVNLCPAKRNDILMVMSDLPNGRALAKAFLVDKNDIYTVNQRVCVLTPYNDSSNYLFYVLNRNPYFLKFDDGVNQTHLLNPVFKKCQIPLPPTKTEQEAIAEALSDADTLIESLERLLAKKRQIKQGAMQELLTRKRRLPGFSREWKIVCMREVLSQPATYGVVKAGAFVQNGTKMIRGGDIADGRVNTELPLISNEKAAEYCRTTLFQNDVVIALVGYPGASAKIPDSLIGSNISRAVGLLRPNRKILSDYIVCFLNSPTGRKMVLAPSAGSAQQVVNLSALNKLEYSIPELEEQSAIATVLSNMDAEIFALESKLSKIRSIKQAMMQQLLTGRIRLV